jgi:CDP-diacylglycerol--serine O-phosphatidyltransferase
MATLSNAAAGLAACALAVAGQPELAALMLLAAVLLDSLDGALARSLGAASAFGAQMDSLADLVSFGVAPAVVVGSLLPPGARLLGWLMAISYALCTAWRLARFNVIQPASGAEHAGFQGLPSTGAGAAAATAVLMHLRLGAGLALLPAVLVFLGALMVSSIPYRHAAAIIARLNPVVAIMAAVLFVVSAVTWEYEYVFGALMWTYAFSGPLVTAREKIRAVRHA